jgi:hypothetical protein
MAPFQPTSGIDCGPFHIPCWGKKKDEFFEGISIKCRQSFEPCLKEIKIG